MSSYWQADVLEEVVHLLKDGELYLFAGAGLSCLAGYPSWTGLLSKFADAYRSLPRQKAEIGRELDVLVKRNNIDIVSHPRSLGDPGAEALVKVLQEVFFDHRTSEAHKVLVRLPFAGYVTTNYDRCFEMACRGVSVAAELIEKRWYCFPQHRCAIHKNLNEIYDGKRFLLHMHGCLYCNGRIDSENIILRRDQYQEFYKQDQLKKIYEELFYRSFLILGTSFNDPMFLNRLYEARGHHSPDLRVERKMCYLLLPSNERREHEASDMSVYGVRFNYFDRNDPSALENMLRELEDKYDLNVLRIATLP